MSNETNQELFSVLGAAGWVRSPSEDADFERQKSDTQLGLAYLQLNTFIPEEQIVVFGYALCLDEEYSDASRKALPEIHKQLLLLEVKFIWEETGELGVAWKIPYPDLGMHMQSFPEILSHDLDEEWAASEQLIYSIMSILDSCQYDEDGPGLELGSPNFVQLHLGDLVQQPSHYVM